MSDDTVLQKVEHEEWRVEKYLDEDGERYRLTLLAQDDGDQEVGISGLEAHEIASLFRAIRALAVLEGESQFGKLIAATLPKYQRD